jgi:hypothetical protein
MRRGDIISRAVSQAEGLADSLRALGLDVQARLLDDMATALISLQVHDAEAALMVDLDVDGLGRKA